MTVALTLAAAAFAQERYVAIFDLDRAGEVAAMTGCDGEGCFEIDLTGIVVRIDPTNGQIVLGVPQEDGSWSMESWDNCHYDYENQMSVCDEFALPERCDCSEPYGWPDGQTPAM